MFVYIGAHLLDPKGQIPRIPDGIASYCDLLGIPMVIRLDRAQKASCGTSVLQISRCLASGGNRCVQYLIL